MKRRMFGLYDAEFFDHYARLTMSNVESPMHYTQGHLEVIYVIEQVLGKEGFKAFCLGNWIKYKTRHEHKNGVEDLAKAEQYLAWATEGLPAPVNGRVPRSAPPKNGKTAASGLISTMESGALAALLQYELDQKDVRKWEVVMFSVTPVGTHYVKVFAHIKSGSCDVRVSLDSVAVDAKYDHIISDILDKARRENPEVRGL